MVFQSRLGFFWKCEQGMLVQKLTFNRYTFGINELVFVKQDLIVFDIARLDPNDIISIHQMAQPNERFRSAGPQFNAGNSAKAAMLTFDELAVSVSEPVGREAQARPAPDPLPIDVDAPLTVLFTSGTSARPKAVVHTSGQHLASARAVIDHLGLGRGDAWLAAVPLYHVGGLSIVFRSVLAGFPVILGGPAASQTGRASVASLVPTQLARLLPAETGDCTAGAKPRIAAERNSGLSGVIASAASAGRDSLRPTIVLGGGPAASELINRAVGAGLRIVTSYGMTETGSQVTATEPSTAPVDVVTAGTPLAGVEIAIADADAQGIGEIRVRAPQVMAGYLDDPAADAATIEDGWLRTGDLGRIDEHGRLVVLTRRCDLISTGGENVVPEEVESVLAGHPDVRDAAVFARADEVWGQIVTAAVVLEGGDETRAARASFAEDLRQWCRPRLAGYKLPREFVFVAELPRTRGGKLSRRMRIERYGDGGDDADHAKQAEQSDKADQAD